MRTLLEVVEEVIENGSYDQQWIYARSCEPGAEAKIGVELSGWVKIARMTDILDAAQAAFGHELDEFSPAEIAAAIMADILE